MLLSPLTPMTDGTVARPHVVMAAVALTPEINMEFNIGMKVAQSIGVINIEMFGVSDPMELQSVMVFAAVVNRAIRRDVLAAVEEIVILNRRRQVRA